MTIRVKNLDSIIHFGKFRGAMRTFRQLFLSDQLDDQSYVAWLARENVLDLTTGEDQEYFEQAVLVAKAALAAARLETIRLRRKLATRRAVDSILFGGFDDCIRDISDIGSMGQLRRIRRKILGDTIDSDDSGNVYPSARRELEDRERELRAQIEREVESEYRRRYHVGFGNYDTGDDAMKPGFSTF